MGERLSDVEEVLECMSKAGMKLELSKLRFRVREVQLLGHEMSSKGLHPSGGLVEDINPFDNRGTKNNCYNFWDS